MAKQPKNSGGTGNGLPGSEEQYRLLFELNPHPMWVFDAETLSFLAVNEAAVHHYGYSREEFLSSTITDICPPEDVPRLRVYLSELPERVDGVGLWRHRKKDGTIIDVEITSQPLAFGGKRARLVLAHDITARKRAEEDARRYAKRLSVLREIDIAILAAFSAEEIADAALRHVRQLVPCQRASVSQFDIEADEARLLAVQGEGEATIMPGMRFPLDVFGDPDQLRQGHTHIVEDLLTISPRPPKYEALLKKGLRSLIHVPLLAEAELIGTLNLAADTPYLLTLEHADIAREVANQLAVAIRHASLHSQVQRHATELERRVAERTAELQEIVVELESFAHSVSHDMREPLGGLQGLARALLENYGNELSSQGQVEMERIIATTERLDVLIQHLLAYSRLGRAELTLQPINLGVVVAEVVSQLEQEIHSKKVQVTVDEPLPAAVGHHATIVQLMTNLVSNALKFVAPGRAPRVRIRAELRAEYVRLWVEDNGIGIAPEDQQRIFQPFERLHGIEAYAGTGIGLAIVQRAVKRMGGRVGVESQLDGGSRFWFELPGVPEGSTQS